MKKENIVGFRISLWDVTNSHKIWEILKPYNCINSIWIPQTIGDQIWMWFEFKNILDKNEYIKNLKSIEILNEWHELKNKRLIDKQEVIIFDPRLHLMQDEEWLTQDEIDYWTK